MATDVLDIDSSSVKSHLTLYCAGILNADGAGTYNGSLFSSLLASIDHDDCTLISNDNGIALKINDGTLICAGSIYEGTKDMSKLNTYYSGNTSLYGCLTKSVTFPCAFTATPVIVTNVASSGYSNSQAASLSTTSCTIRHWLNYGNNAVTGIEYSYIAIGKWK